VGEGIDGACPIAWEGWGVVALRQTINNEPIKAMNWAKRAENDMGASLMLQEEDIEERLNMHNTLLDKTVGWRRVAGPGIADWARAAAPVAINIVTASTEPWRCGGTWFVGLDVLPNDAAGRIAGAVLPWDELGLEPVALHPAQVSIVRAGYPQPSASESDAAFRFRLNRDSAHLDGLIAEGRVVVPGRVGEAVVLHRLLIHGVAPWAEGAQAAAPGRSIAYFRPVMGSVAEWLSE